jgi:phosphatidate cytidylyltransferase
MVAPRAAARRYVPWVYLSIVLQAVFAGVRWWWWFVLAAPVGMVIVLGIGAVVEGVRSRRRVAGGRWQEAGGRWKWWMIGRFLRDAGNLYWGVIVIVYLPAHAAWLAGEPPASNPAGGGAGWLLYLVMLTEINDISQALIGRRIGRRRITPIISPHKTWEGFFGGLMTTVLLAVLLAPFLTPFSDGTRVRALQSMPLVWAATAGLLIAVVGFLGDIDISAVKRERGVKDSGTLLPGQGGILDRIDSLTFSAPCFLYYVKLVCG